MKKLLLLCFVSFVCPHSLWANDYAELVTYRDSLKKQIEAVDSEIARCQKSLKGWEITTIVGGVGAIASGIGIIAQKNKIKENQNILNEVSSEAKEADVAIKFIQEVN